MRDTKELLGIMLENIERIDNGGMCRLVDFLWLSGVISVDEAILLDDYLIQNEPTDRDISAFWFKRGEVEPRKKWLEEEIKKL